MIDVVDKDDKVVGQLPRSEVLRQGLLYRDVGAFVVRAGKLLIPVRSRKKERWAGWMDLSISGVVSAGEGYFEALGREGWEEVRLRTSEVRCERLGKLTPHQHGALAFVEVYRIEVDEGTALDDWNRDDFDEVLWLTPEELRERIAAGQPAKKGLQLALQHFC